MILEHLIVKEELLAEVAPWVRQDLGALLRASIAVFNVTAQGLQVIRALLSDKHRASFQTNLAKGLLMIRLKMSAEALDISEPLL